ncbi:hypothetical protein FACS1894120_2830 [Clostridia bacterium]|nr:hypothetical protein FACS1894120_2830 [Clostridia bacterium]
MKKIKAVLPLLIVGICAFLWCVMPVCAAAFDTYTAELSVSAFESEPGGTDANSGSFEVDDSADYDDTAIVGIGASYDASVAREALTGVKVPPTGVEVAVYPAGAALLVLIISFVIGVIIKKKKEKK